MKTIKALALVTILFFATSMQAQDFEKWPAMQSVSDVITRIEKNPKDNQVASMTRFSETLKNFCDQSIKTIPQQQSTTSKKAALNLQTAVNNLSNLVQKNSSDALLISAFNNVRTKFAEFKEAM